MATTGTEGERLRERRVRLRMNVIALARLTEELGFKVSHETIHNIERGETRPRPTTLAKIEQALDHAERREQEALVEPEESEVVEVPNESPLLATYEVRLSNGTMARVTQPAGSSTVKIREEVEALLKMAREVDPDPPADLAAWRR